MGGGKGIPGRGNSDAKPLRLESAVGGNYQ